MVLTLVLFLVGDVINRKIQARKLKTSVPGTASSEPEIHVGLKVEDLVLLPGLFYHRGHTWAGVDFSGKIKVGLDDFA